KNCERSGPDNPTVYFGAGGRGDRVNVLDPRGQLLRATLGFAGCSMPSYDRALHALRTWLDSWSGIGHVTVGMARQGYDLQLTRYDEKGWRATFYTTGTWHAVQGAARDALRQASRSGYVARLSSRSRAGWRAGMSGSAPATWRAASAWLTWSRTEGLTAASTRPSSWCTRSATPRRG